MNLLSILIMNICISTIDPKCVEKIHVCVRENFELNWFDDLTWQEELVLPVQINWCQAQKISK